MRNPQNVLELRKIERDAVNLVSDFREAMSEYWKPVTIVDSLRYLGQETNEARDAWMRATRDHARNNTNNVSMKEELADVVIMGVTAMGLVPGWHPYTEIDEITTDLDDLCSLASSAMDMYRWRELYTEENRDVWWLIDTELVVLGAIDRLGDEFYKEFIGKLNYLVTRHVPIEEREAVFEKCPWLLDRIST